MATRTLLELRQEARLLCNQPSSAHIAGAPLVPDSNVNRYINQGISNLSSVLNKSGFVFNEQEHTIISDGVTKEFAVPANFMRTLSVFFPDDSMKIHRGRYRIKKNEAGFFIVFSCPPTDDYTHRYNASYTLLSGDADTIFDFNNYLEMVPIWTALKMTTTASGDSNSQLKELYISVIERIKEDASSLDIIEMETVGEDFKYSDQFYSSFYTFFPVG